MAKLGADPEQLSRLAARLNTIGGDLAALSTTVSAEVGAVDWLGPDADRFRDAWKDRERDLRRVADTLIEASVHLGRQAREQQEVSGEGGFGRTSPGVSAGIPPQGGITAAGRSAVGDPAAFFGPRGADPGAFERLGSGGRTAGALAEWGGFAPDPSTDQFASAARQTLGENGLSWTDALGVEGSGEAHGEFNKTWSVEGATAGQYGGVDWNARGRVMAGLGGEYSASAGISDDRINAQFEAGVYAGASASGEVEGNVGFIPFEARGAAAAGAEGTAAGDLTIGAEGVGASAAADAFLGASADAQGKIGSDRYGSVGGGASASAGVGAHADFSGNVGWDEVSFGADVGATLGIGTDAGFEVSFNPSGVADQVSDWGAGILGGLADTTLGGATGEIEDALGGMSQGAGDVLEGAADIGEKTLDSVGKTASKLNPLSW